MKLQSRVNSFFLVQPPGWIRQILHRMVWRVPVRERVLFLTFDDGPIPGRTDWILDRLAEYNARATFFCVGANVEKYPGEYARILDAGHSTGNHTYSHLNGFCTGNQAYIEDVGRAACLIQSRLFRPPYGRIRPKASRILRKDYHLILWDVLSMDYDSGLDPQRVLRNVLARCRPGSIIVFHDHEKARKSLEYTLPKVLDHFTREGYKFLPLGAILT